MYIRINLINPRDIAFSETFPNPQGAIVLRIEDNQVFTYANGDWMNTYQSKSTISTFYRISELMTKVMAMHAENLRGMVHGEEEFEQIIAQMQILTSAK